MRFRPLLVVGLGLLAGSASAQTVPLDLPVFQSLSGTAVSLMILITVISLAPGIAIMITCFPFMVTVMAILRQALGLQQSPPNMLLVSLALFLTYFVMDPVFSEAWDVGIEPMVSETLPAEEALKRAFDPFERFMTARVDPETLTSLANIRSFDLSQDSAPASVLIPSFMLSEIARAFQVGFLIFLPFLIIDLVVAAILMSMGMMMVPPAIVSLPFKLAFFVVADGWRLISEGLVRGYM